MTRPAVSSITTSNPCSRAAVIALLAMDNAVSPFAIGKVVTSICSPKTFSCSRAAGRATSSEAISTFFLSRLVNLAAILAVLVVFPPPCKPTIMIGTGGTAFSSIQAGSVPSTSIRLSLTILITCCPGVTDRITSWPIALSLTLSTNDLTTSRATSASNNATRTSRIATVMSASLRAPRPLSLSNTVPRRSDKASNK